MKLDPSNHDWLTDKRAARIFAALPPGSTRFVGGCVRNAILGVPIGDIDLATQLEPDAARDHLEAAKIKVIPTGIDHGTVTAVIEGIPHEITSLRKDVEADGRRAVVAFTQDWAEDAVRRDLTMNALYADPDGQVHDPTGRGIEDAQARRLRFVGDADDRVREDYLRILRFFRFLAFYGGDAKLDPGALTACRENRRGLKTLSAERVWSEIKKLLSAPEPVRAAHIMLQQEILEVVLPEASNVEGLQRLAERERMGAIEIDPLLRLMAMASRDPLGIRRLCERLKLSNREKARLTGWAEHSAALAPGMAEKDAKAEIYNSGGQAIFDRASLRAAGADDPVLASKWQSLATLAKEWEPPDFPIRGKDLEKAGVPKGPEMGRSLKALEALWVRSGFTANKDRLLMALALINRGN